MFVPSGFLDIVGNMKRGELIKTFGDKFSSSEDDTDKLVFFETTSKFLIYEDDFKSLDGQFKEMDIPNGVKSITMDPNPV
jgi:hypothetical protein